MLAEGAEEHISTKNMNRAGFAASVEHT